MWVRGTMCRYFVFVIDAVFTKHVLSMQYTLKESLYCNLIIFIFSTKLYSKWEGSHIR